MPTNPSDRQRFLKELGCSDSVVGELLGYTQNKFVNRDLEYCLDDSPQIEVYQKYQSQAGPEGVFHVLQKNLVQLQFPIRQGISQTEAYRNVTLCGRTKSDAYELRLLQPEHITLEIYESGLIGKIPVLVVPNDDDFATVVCALSNRNEPKRIPPSMGAAFIKGINNWGRIKELRNQFLVDKADGSWNHEFKQHILPKDELYKDQLIVLSTKPYSNISPDMMGMDKSSWIAKALQIRLNHECAHLFTLKYYGDMSNNIHDEVIADYVGITSVLGTFSSSWFLHFMGLERFPDYREGGRLQNYIGDLSGDAFRMLQVIVKRAVESISRFDQVLDVPGNKLDRMNRVKSICECDLIGMAMEGGTQYLLDTYESRFSPQV